MGSVENWIIPAVLISHIRYHEHVFVSSATPNKTSGEWVFNVIQMDPKIENGDPGVANILNIPSGKHTKNYGKSLFLWVNPL